MKKLIIIIMMLSVVLTGCTSANSDEIDQLKQDLAELQGKVAELETSNTEYINQIEDMTVQNQELQQTIEMSFGSLTDLGVTPDQLNDFIFQYLIDNASVEYVGSDSLPPEKTVVDTLTGDNILIYTVYGDTDTENHISYSYRVGTNGYIKDVSATYYPDAPNENLKTMYDSYTYAITTAYIRTVLPDVTDGVEIDQLEDELRTYSTWGYSDAAIVEVEYNDSFSTYSLHTYVGGC